MAIRLNMLSRMVRNDRQPRTRNGQPDHRTTGVASTSSAQRAVRAPSQSATGSPSIGPIASTSSGAVSAAPTTKRRRKSTSSGSGPASAGGSPFGSSAMPQIGQVPGPTCSISGCIGQV